MKLMAEWFWIDRWDGSSAVLLPLEARGLYREMLSAAWRRDGCLPNDPEAIQRAVRCTAKEWARCWPKVAPYWRQEGDTLVNDTQQQVLAEARSAQARAQARAQAGAQARHKQVLKHVPEQVLKQCSPSPSPVNVGETTERVGAVYSGDGRTAPDPSPSPDTVDDHDGERRTEGDEYVRLVWEAFGAKRGPELHRLGVMSSAEWELARGWRESGIPLRVVLRAIQDCDVHRARSLLYLKGAVTDAHAYWVRASA